MHTNTLEETELTDNTSEPQQEQPETTASPEPEEAQPETQEQEVTALVPIEPEVIEGEVIELEKPDTAGDHLPPRQKPYWLLIPFTILLCLEFIAASILFPLLAPTATVTIIPVERTITRTTTIRVSGRELLPLTLMQSLSAPATGKQHHHLLQRPACQPNHCRGNRLNRLGWSTSYHGPTRKHSGSKPAF